MNLYAGSDGRYYTDWQVSWRFENDEWRACMWDTEEGWELVEEEEEEELVWLEPVGREDLPDWAELRPERHGTVVVDRREADDRGRVEPRVEGRTG